MSLLDFDNDDDAGFDATVAADAKFHGQTTTMSIDDPFGFDVFGSDSIGITNTKSGVVAADAAFTKTANTGNLFDDFDPFGYDSKDITKTSDPFTSSVVSTSNTNHVDELFDFSNSSQTVVVETGSFPSTANTRSLGESSNGDDDDDLGDASEKDDLPSHGKPPTDHAAAIYHQEFPEEKHTEHNQDQELKVADMADKEVDDDADDDSMPYQFKKQTDKVNPHANKEEDSFSNYFALDNQSRGCINIEEIRQRSYEDMENISQFPSRDQNLREQKTAADKTPPPSVYVLSATADNQCKVCSKRVYEMEKITADLQVYHKSCFRCSHCNRILSLGSFSTNDGRLYCKPHFIEIFKTKGNYKDSFAAAERQKQNKHKIDDHENPTNSSYENGTNSSSEKNETLRRRHSSSSGVEEYDEADVAGISIQEEIPVVQIKSVRSIFEKMSQDQSLITKTQKKAGKGSSHGAQNQEKGQQKQTEKLKTDIRKPEAEREQQELVQRKDSISEREIVLSSTTCIIEDELPPPSFTKSMLAKFKMMEDVSGGEKKFSVNYGKWMPSKVTASSDVSSERNNQTVNYRLSTGSEGSSDAVSVSDQHGRVNDTKTSSQIRSAEEPVNELPQSGLAKSLLAQWRNLEEQSKRGRNRELKKTSGARRSQSMSRVETAQRANVYRNIDLDSRRSRKEEDLRRTMSFSDQEVSDDDSPVSMPTKQSLAKFKELEGERSLHESEDQHKMRRRFKWEVKEAVPLNRGGIIVHGDIPKRPLTEEAVLAKSSENLTDGNSLNMAYSQRVRDGSNERDVNVISNDAHSRSTPTLLNEDELPAPATTRTLLQHFKSMEDVTKAPPLPRPSPSEITREVALKTKSVISTAIGIEDDYKDVASRSVISAGARHIPDSDSDDCRADNANSDHFDLRRSSDSYDDDEMPAQGTTRNLLAKFQSLQNKH